MPRRAAPPTLTDVPVASLAPTIAWLRAHDVPVARVAAAFNTTPGHVRVLAHRGARVHTRPLPRSSRVRPTVETRQRLGIRTHTDYVGLTRRETGRLEDLIQTADAIREAHAAQYRFVDGLAALRALHASVGYAAHTGRIRLKARLHEHTAWFAVHSGFTTTALVAATRAMALSQIALNEHGGDVDRARSGDAMLIASQAYLLAGEPTRALEMLESKRGVAERLGSRLGSDFYRQRGVAFFQLGHDAAASRAFRLAVHEMEAAGEAEHPIQLAFTGPRYLHLLGTPDGDRAWILAADATTVFGPQSLEASMARHWAVACDLSTDSPASHRRALEHLQRMPSALGPFGHQATVSRLLRMTLELQLPHPLRRTWIRRALYTNAFRAA